MGFLLSLKLRYETQCSMHSRCLHISFLSSYSFQEQSFLPKFQQAVFVCIDEMDEKHFKICTREILVDIMHACGKILLPLHSYDEVCTIVEPFWLTLCLKCFLHPSLEKRILAIDDIAPPEPRIEKNDDERCMMYH